MICRKFRVLKPGVYTNMVGDAHAVKTEGKRAVDLTNINIKGAMEMGHVMSGEAIELKDIRLFGKTKGYEAIRATIHIPQDVLPTGGQVYTAQRIKVELVLHEEAMFEDSKSKLQAVYKLVNDLRSITDQDLSVRFEGVDSDHPWITYKGMFYITEFTAYGDSGGTHERKLELCSSDYEIKLDEKKMPKRTVEMSNDSLAWLHGFMLRVGDTKTVMTSNHDSNNARALAKALQGEVDKLGY